MNHADLTAHHIGCLTDNIESSMALYRQLGFQNISQVFTVSTQNVRVCFIEVRENFYLELVEFTGANPSLQKIFKTGNPYYHVGYRVKNITAVLEELQLTGYRLVNQFCSEAFQNKRCAFLYSPQMHLIELIEE